MIKVVKKINNGIVAFEKVLLVIMMAAIIVLAVLQVLSRSVFKAPITWSEGLCGTSNYSFAWGMCGENQLFDDMDGIATKDLI